MPRGIWIVVALLLAGCPWNKNKQLGDELPDKTVEEPNNDEDTPSADSESSPTGPENSPTLTGPPHRSSREAGSSVVGSDDASDLADRGNPSSSPSTADKPPKEEDNLPGFLRAERDEVEEWRRRRVPRLPGRVKPL